MELLRMAFPEIIKDQQHYDNWVASLKHGDPCVVQVFHPQSNSFLDYPVECWKFWKAEYLGNKVRYCHDVHPIRKDGLCCYWGSDTPWGEVFSARLIPLDNCYRFNGGDCFFAVSPVFEPAYTNSCRCYFLDVHGPNFGKCYPTQINESPHYSRKVIGGDLVTVFGDINELAVAAKDSHLKYLYAEHLSF